MDSSIQLALVLGVIFLSTFTRSALGFGDALIAMPLLAMIIGMQAATPLVAMVASTIAFTILLRAWRQVNIQAAWRLVISTIVGIPIGLFFLKSAPEHIAKMVLGAVLVGFGLYNLIAPRLPALKSERWSYVFGLAAGILGGAYNTNGPPVVIYGVLREWDPERFRATLQGYFLPTGMTILIGHALAGLWTAEVLKLYAFCLPLVIGAVLVGGWVNRRLPEKQFNRVVYAFLVAIGLLLFL
jgi:uncharacterized membrane protein YfcA